MARTSVSWRTRVSFGRLRRHAMEVAQMNAVRLLGALVALALPTSVLAEAPASRPLAVGDKAPDFTLLSNEWKEVKLSDFHGKKNVVLVFYVLAFTDT